MPPCSFPFPDGRLSCRYVFVASRFSGHPGCSMQKKHNFLGGRHEETAHPRRRGNGRGEKRRLPRAVAAAHAGRLAGRRLVLEHEPFCRFGPLLDIPFTLHSFALVCTEQALRERLERDVRDGIREADVIPRSLRRLPAYAALPTCKLDVTSLTPYEAACAIAASVGRASSRRVPGLSGAGESWHGA